MLYRITYKNFLVHMIDYFTKEELLHCQYVLVSAKIGNTGTRDNVVRMTYLYPNADLIYEFEEDHDEEKARKAYLNYLFPDKKNRIKNSDRENANDPYWCYRLTYNTFVTPLKLHHDIVLVYEEETKLYIDALCDALKDKFQIEMLDLNKLFEKGKVGPIYLDRKAIEDNLKPRIKKLMAQDEKAQEATEDGRSQLLSKMSVQEKIKKLKKLGIKITKKDINDDRLNKLLYEAWVSDD